MGGCFLTPTKQYSVRPVRRASLGATLTMTAQRARPRASTKGAKVEDDRMDEGMGGSFWLKVFGVLVLGGIAAMLVFLIFEAVWYRWSLLGAIVLFTAVLLGIAWLGDRRSHLPCTRLGQTDPPLR